MGRDETQPKIGGNSSLPLPYILATVVYGKHPCTKEACESKHTPQGSSVVVVRIVHTASFILRTYLQQVVG